MVVKFETIYKFYIYIFFYRYNDDLRNISSELSRKCYIGSADKRNNVKT